MRRILFPVTLLTWAIPCESRRITPIWDGVRPFFALFTIWSMTWVAVTFNHDGADLRYGRADREIPLLLKQIEARNQNLSILVWKQPSKQNFEGNLSWDEITKKIENRTTHSTIHNHNPLLYSIQMWRDKENLPFAVHATHFGSFAMRMLARAQNNKKVGVNVFLAF